MDQMMRNLAIGLVLLIIFAPLRSADIRHCIWRMGTV